MAKPRFSYDKIDIQETFRSANKEKKVDPWWIRRAKYLEGAGRKQELKEHLASKDTWK